MTPEVSEARTLAGVAGLGQIKGQASGADSAETWREVQCPPTPLNDIELGRCVKRAALFERRGLSADAAETLADRLARRDRERDDRQCCIECDSLQQPGTCFRGLPISRTQLVRCAGFGWAMP